MANPRRLIVCDNETWERLKVWAAAHDVQGYHGRPTVAATLRKLLDAVEQGGGSTTHALRSKKRKLTEDIRDIEASIHALEALELAANTPSPLP